MRLPNTCPGVALMVADGFDRAPLDGLTRTEPADPMVLAAALAGAAASIARLDQALASHPLAQAFLYRARLESVRRQAAVDGQLIDPWHLAATIEGLRLRMDPYLRIIDRGDILDKAEPLSPCTSGSSSRTSIRRARCSAPRHCWRFSRRRCRR